MDKIDDPSIEANQKNGSSAAGRKDAASAKGDAPAPDRPVEPPDPAELRPSFLSELATAMRATAQRERDRIASVVAGDAAAHVDKVRARAAIETEELRRLAEEDVQHIEEWSASEIDRIRAEAEQRISDRRASLDEYLRQHDTIIDTEIQGVDAAVRDYNATLDRFFEELSEAGDPAAIVERAESLPPAPDLDQVRARARASAVALFAEEEAASDAAQAERSAASTGTEGAVSSEAQPDVAPAGAGGDGSADTAVGTTEAVGEAPASSNDASWSAIEDRPATASTDDVATEDRPSALASASAEPVPVMDATPSGAPAWPPAPASSEMEDRGSEPEISPVVDHTSAAVRLLRSVAPWTAPTHAGSERRPDTDSE